MTVHFVQSDTWERYDFSGIRHNQHVLNGALGGSVK